MAKRKTETEIREKHANVLEGSLRYLDPEGDIPEDLMKYKGKQVVIRTCTSKDLRDGSQFEGCGEEFVVATSDLHQKPICNDCVPEAKKANNKIKRDAERVILEAANVQTITAEDLGL